MLASALKVKGLLYELFINDLNSGYWLHTTLHSRSKVFPTTSLTPKFVHGIQLPTTPMGILRPNSQGMPHRFISLSSRPFMPWLVSISNLFFSLLALLALGSNLAFRTLPLITECEAYTSSPKYIGHLLNVRRHKNLAPPIGARHSWRFLNLLPEVQVLFCTPKHKASFHFRSPAVSLLEVQVLFCTPKHKVNFHFQSLFSELAGALKSWTDTSTSKHWTLVIFLLIPYTLKIFLLLVVAPPLSYPVPNSDLSYGSTRSDHSSQDGRILTNLHLPTPSNLEEADEKTISAARTDCGKESSVHEVCQKDVHRSFCETSAITEANTFTEMAMGTTPPSSTLLSLHRRSLHTAGVQVSKSDESTSQVATPTHSKLPHPLEPLETLTAAPVIILPAQLSPSCDYGNNATEMYPESFPVPMFSSKNQLEGKILQVSNYEILITVTPVIDVSGIPETYTATNKRTIPPMLLESSFAQGTSTIVIKWGVHTRRRGFLTCLNQGADRAWINGELTEEDSCFTSSMLAAVSASDINNATAKQAASRSLTLRVAQHSYAHDCATMTGIKMIAIRSHQNALAMSFCPGSHSLFFQTYKFHVFHVSCRTDIRGLKADFFLFAHSPKPFADYPDFFYLRYLLYNTKLEPWAEQFGIKLKSLAHIEIHHDHFDTMQATLFATKHIILNVVSSNKNNRSYDWWQSGPYCAAGKLPSASANSDRERCRTIAVSIPQNDSSRSWSTFIICFPKMGNSVIQHVLDTHRILRLTYSLKGGNCKRLSIDGTNPDSALLSCSPATAKADVFSLSHPANRLMQLCQVKPVGSRVTVVTFSSRSPPPLFSFVTQHISCKFEEIQSSLSLFRNSDRFCIRLDRLLYVPGLHRTLGLARPAAFDLIFSPPLSFLGEKFENVVRVPFL
ncbi:uncharacterized protein BDR25DRAFT_357558 [Lindgomyces ingoldianus]|uniref:Uncharacterized protein n=1 Tax=Lindgomyces ingoldianus TaxID=673940 RepID=A0ACB6QR96_9PLEO|nr:uncharacterized protein BDR25DRAFT_357558 [Lindgomyces ingoldianus]KAF2468620.1 hypothetical protein BDR25DRAFT_357558 [Lindgomyces ingoldianus]